MKTKNDAKIEENLNCQFKTDMKNLMIFHPSTLMYIMFYFTYIFSPKQVRKSKNWDFYWALLSKIENV